MLIDTAMIPPTGLDLTGDEPADILDLGAEEGLSPASPVRVEVHASCSGSHFVVAGQVSVRMAFACSRCAAPFERTVTEGAFSADRELTDEGEFVDLTPDIRESILLAFPAHPVCGADCKGLCPTCGKNLNEGPCDCRPPDDARWSALDGLGPLD